MLIVISLFLLTLVMLLAIPISLSFKINEHSESKNKIVVRWFFGLIKFRVPLTQDASPVSESRLKKSTKTGSDKRSKKIFKLLLQKNFRHRLFEYVRDVWRSIVKQDIKLHIKTGLGDPADTGKLWGIVGPISSGLVHVHHLPVFIEPDFMYARFEINGHGTLRFIPLRIIFVSLKLFFSPVLWKGLRQIRQAEKL
ncbi:DUF2953 domain-containing protein [Marinicella sp. W31]|uniref:DUF2953 domain-containing protein n=1 Tax=Marinicella sp. W31 TaxID=3023713 RepID=UPI003757AF80